MNFLRSLAPKFHRRHFIAMGTRISITINERQCALTDFAIGEVQQQLIAFGRDAWAWGPGALADFNRQLSVGGQATIPVSLRPLFRKAWSIHQATEGHFEPRIAALVRLWGFDDAARTRSTPPDATEITRLLTAMQSAPAYDGGDHYGPAPAVGWDFGALGKGYIVDRVLDHLTQLGFRQVSVDAGGHIGLRGLNGDRPWRIGIRDPRAAGEAVPPLVSLDACEEAVVTHADDQRYFEHGGLRYAHLLNAKTGWPVHGLQSLTVVHHDGCIADAAGAALFVAGATGWQALAQKLDLSRVFAVLADGTVQVTRALAPVLRPRAGLSFQVVD